MVNTISNGHSDLPLGGWRAGIWLTTDSLLHDCPAHQLCSHTIGQGGGGGKDPPPTMPLFSLLPTLKSPHCTPPPLSLLDPHFHPRIGPATLRSLPCQPNQLESSSSRMKGFPLPACSWVLQPMPLLHTQTSTRPCSCLAPLCPPTASYCLLSVAGPCRG